MKRKVDNHKETALKVRRTVTRHPAKSRPPAEDPFRSILHSSAEFYGTWSPSSSRFLIDGRGWSTLGYPDSSSRRLHLQTLIHPEDRAVFEAHFHAHLTGEIPTLDCELRLRSNAGHYRWFQMRGRTTRKDRHGAPAEISYALFDIQPGKERLEVLQASHDLLAAIVEHSQDCISVVDPVEFRLVTFNAAFADVIVRAHGVRVAKGMRAEDVAPATAELWNAFHRDVLAQGQIDRDYLVPGLNQTHHVFAQHLVRDGRDFGICVFGHDVTDRKRTEMALRRSEEKFSKAFLEAPFPLSLTSLRDNRYLEVNEAFLESTGYSREELIGRTPFEIHLWVHPKKRIEVARRVQSGEVVRHIDITYRTKSGEIREAVSSGSRIDIDGEPCLLGVITDVTDRKRAIEALRESEERLRIAIEAGHMYTFEWNLATDVVERSKQSIAMLDLVEDGSPHTKQEFIGRLQPGDRQRYCQVIDALTPEKPDYKTVMRLSHRDGKIIWLEESGRAIFGPDEKLQKIIGITSDVTEQREAERALRELSGRLITSQEEERRRIARELHDHIGQEAALICVQAQRLDSGVADEEHTARSDAHDLYKRIKVLANDVSKLSHRLHSSELTFLGLAIAAERLCRDFSQQYGIDVEYQLNPLPANLDTAKSLCLYRLLQETLQNVAKHSHATRVTVELQVKGSELVLNVRDNGDGFDVRQTSPGLGLLSMRERVNYVGGQFAITSRPGYGTGVKASVTL